ncbi:sensor histidine kinase [Clostridium hydrogenum]|uniref:sensor histidine kinase n=1 Tax=Clostridium hydrogenum TaxID=2855764 RepID=UPI001F2E5EC2|nr:GHKL domain-containing protein [Clostridium hydrogenum]
MNIVYLFINPAVSWMISLIFMHKLNKIIIYDIVFIEFINIIVQLLLIFFKINIQMYNYVFINIFVFLLIALIIHFHAKVKFSDCILLFLIAEGAQSIFEFIEYSCPAIFDRTISYGIEGSIFFICICAVFFFSKYSLDSEWQDYFIENKPENEKINIHIWQIYMLIIMQCIVERASFILVQERNRITLIFIIVFLTIIYFGTISVVLLMIAYKREKVDMFFERQYRNEMQSFMDVIRSQRHDYNFHVQTLAGMIYEGNIDSCKNYVDELVKDSIAMNTLLPIKDPAISALINNFRMISARDGIELHIDIKNDMSNIATNVYETNKIISNLLQNAIDETKTHTDKSYGIWLYILKRGEFCVIHVANKLKNDIVEGELMKDVYKQGYTTKEGHSGIGLSSIYTLSLRYRGIVYTRLEGDIVHFIAKIPFNI